MQFFIERHTPQKGYSRIFFLLFFLSLTISISKIGAQKGYFSLESDLSAGWRILSNKNSEKYVKKRNLEESPIVTTSLLLKYHQPLSNNFTVSSGLGYSVYGYQFSDWLIDPCFSFITCDYVYESHKYQFNYLTIPLEVSFNITNRLAITSGLGINLPLRVSRKWILMNNDFRFIGDKIQVNESIDELEKTIFSGRVDLRYQFNKEKALIDEIAIFSSMMIGKLENDHIERSLYNISLLVGEDKLLEERLINFGFSLKRFFRRGG